MCPGLRRVDHVVELEQRGSVERLGVLLGQRGQLADSLLALALIGDRLELPAEPQPDRSLEPHRAQMGGRLPATAWPERDRWCY